MWRGSSRDRIASVEPTDAWTRLKTRDARLAANGPLLHRGQLLQVDALEPFLKLRRILAHRLDLKEVTLRHQEPERAVLVVVFKCLEAGEAFDVDGLGVAVWCRLVQFPTCGGGFDVVGTRDGIENADRGGGRIAELVLGVVA